MPVAFITFDKKTSECSNEFKDFLQSKEVSVRMEKCYARGVGGCSCRVSNEHYFSHSLFKLLAGNETLNVEGFPWIPRGSSRDLPSERLGSKILCTTHNNQLSPFDAEALRFFSLLRYETPISTGQVDSQLLERWYLKALIGCVVATRKTGQGGTWSPPIGWLRILYHNEPFPLNTGLYFPLAGKKTRGVYNGADFQVYYADPELRHPGGLYLRLGWMVSYFCIIPEIFPDGYLFVHRPKDVSVTYPGKKKVAIFPWLGSSVGFYGPIPPSISKMDVG